MGVLVFRTPHWFWVARHALIDDIREFGGPILALYASKDASISPRLMTDLLETESPPSLEYRTLDCLNHLFQRTSMSEAADYAKGGPILDGETIPALSKWLDRNSQRSLPDSS